MKIKIPLLVMIIFCSKTQEGWSNSSTPVKTTIDYSTCSLNNACELSFQYMNMNQTTQFIITSITTKDLPALLQASPGIVTEASWFSANSPLNCKITGTTITCQNFAPIADHFILSGKIGVVDIDVDVTIDLNGVVPAVDSPIPGMPGYSITVCGQYGMSSSSDASFYTTAQRMYDCSKRVAAYAGIGNGNDTYTPFVLGASNPDDNWFLVTCPFADKARQNKCSWLSPVISASNATGLNQFTSTVNGVKMPVSAVVGHRLLWSGILTIPSHMINSKIYPPDTADFFYANGNNPWSSNPAKYDFYDYQTTSGGSKNIAYLSGKMCAPNSAGCMSPDDNINSSFDEHPVGDPYWMPVTYSQSICQKQIS